MNTSSDFFSTVVPFALARTEEFLTTGLLDTSIESPIVIKVEKPHYDDEEYVQKANTLFHCDICLMNIQSAQSYEDHLKGRKHKKQLMWHNKQKEKVSSW